MYKGALRSGGTARVTLQCDQANHGAALVAVAFAKKGGGQASAATAIAPGGTDRVTIKLDKKGWLRIWVDMNSDADRGQLTVDRADQPVTSEPITGDTTWTYTVV